MKGCFFMYIVGIDIAKKFNKAIVTDRSNGDILIKPFNFYNTKEGYNFLINKLNSLSVTKSDFIFAMESTANYWMPLYCALQRDDYDVKVINPIQSKAFRSMNIRPMKNDAVDSFVIAEVVRFGNYSTSLVKDEKVFELRELCRARSYIVDMASDLKRKITSILDLIFPEYSTAFSSIFCLGSIAILNEYPTPKAICKATKKKLKDILDKASRKAFKDNKVDQIKQLAKASFGVDFASETFAFILQKHIEQYNLIQTQVKEFDKEINEIYVSFDTNLTTIPGIGDSSAAIILSEIGDISLFQSASKLAAFAGIDPTVNQSGEYNSKNNHMSKRGSPYLRRALWQVSISAARCNSNLKIFFERKRSQGKAYMNAIGHITRKMVNIIFAVLRDKKPFYLPTVA